ncbi:MAG: hydantoinase/oxoprolinase family protein [Pirellulales bacterium]
MNLTPPPLAFHSPFSPPPGHRVLALDIGGANLKAADAHGFVLTRPFALWKQPELLVAELASLLAASPPHDTVVAAMTGELADCYCTKAEGVNAIVQSLEYAAGPRTVFYYRTDGQLVGRNAALAEPLLTAAANWHAVATFAARLAGGRPGLLIDIGSTTCDIIPFANSRETAQGRTDPERLMTGELVYTGVERSPVCAMARTLPWRDGRARVAQELFATMRDAYLILGELAEESDCRNTADGRPATRTAAHDRLARAMCADRTMFSELDAWFAAEELAENQLNLLTAAVRQVCQSLPDSAGAPAKRERPQVAVVSGQGEFVARRLASGLGWPVEIIALSTLLGADVSRCATAHALAVLAHEVGVS